MVLDIFSYKAVSRAIDRRAETGMVNLGLDMASATRECTKDSILYSDHGPQLTAWTFTTNVGKYGLKLSLGTVGDCL